MTKCVCMRRATSCTSRLDSHTGVVGAELLGHRKTVCTARLVILQASRGRLHLACSTTTSVWACKRDLRSGLLSLVQAASPCEAATARLYPSSPIRTCTRGSSDPHAVICAPYGAASIPLWVNHF